MSEEILDQLEKLAELNKKGILTEDEFRQKKMVLLEKMKVSGHQNNGASVKAQNGGSKAFSVTSMVLGIISFLTFFDDSPWDSDVISGVAIFTVTGLIFGIISVSKGAKGKGMAIAGIVLSSISLVMLADIVATLE